MYHASTEVTVKAIEPHKRILIEWDGYCGRTTVEWKFAPQKDGTTFVSITESGWTGDGDELVKYATNSMRRTKSTRFYRRTGTIRAVQLLRGNTKNESTVRYSGVEVDVALEIAENIEV